MQMMTPRRTLAVLTAVAGCLTSALAVAPSSAAPAAAAPVTVRVFVAPATASGHPAPGFTVKADPQGIVYCAPAEASQVAVSSNVETCSPSAAYAVACWRSATPKRVLCLQDPRRKQLRELTLSGKFAATSPISKRRLAPFGIVLSDGTYCTIRDGGAWGQRKSQPNFFGSYSCTKHGVVWSPPNAAHFGVDESKPSWTVKTGNGAGTGPLTTRHVVRAYFVATATG